MSTEPILFERSGPVFIVTFNRPDRGNAFTGSMAKTLCDKFKLISEDRAIRAVLLRGNGEHFMNGHDLLLYAGDINAIQDQVFQKVQFFYTALREMTVMEKPVICAVHGRVSGAGFNFMLASDLVISARSTIFNTGFTADAMVPDGGATFFLPRKVGMGKANELLMLSEDFTAESAEKWALINRIIGDDNFQSEALSWVAKIAEGPTRALGATKRLVG
jgi:2-(1,2-epoxy-1,2-dihydrophenyl)acetyl-CoA isomerase